jgi:PBP1b-binding outer membrane lipoprotein LpoB
VQRTACSTILSAVAIATALGLGGCSAHHSADPAASVEEQTEALTDVMVKLADPDVPGAQKVGLVEYATPDDAAALDKFGHALRDSGYTPLSFEARDLNWAKDQAGNVTATIVVKTANPQSGDFTFPMEFSPSQGSWQLTRETADMLLALGQEPAPTPTR